MCICQNKPGCIEQQNNISLNNVETDSPHAYKIIGMYTFKAGLYRLMLKVHQSGALQD